MSNSWAVEIKSDKGTWVRSPYDAQYLCNSKAKEIIDGKFHSLHWRIRNVDTDECEYPTGIGPPVDKVTKDLKATSGKAQLSQLPYDALVYASKAFEYGCVPWKYERGNFLRSSPDLLAAFDRLSLYLDAAMRHTSKAATSMNRARGCTEKGPGDLKAGAYAQDPESGLPHLCGAVASLLMGIQIAVDAGLLPAELGKPWEALKPKDATLC